MKFITLLSLVIILVLYVLPVKTKVEWKRDSKNVYVLPNQGGNSVYKIQDNKVVSMFIDRVCPY